MNDFELLKFAAKAIGLNVWRGQGHQEDMLFRSPNKSDHEGVVTGIEWNPLTNDGDALRLAVKLMEFMPYKGRGYLPCITSNLQNTRLAIVRAAAEIGKAMA